MGPLSENIKEVTKNGNPLSEDDKNKLQPGDDKKLTVSKTDTLSIVMETQEEVDKIEVLETTNVKEVNVILKDEDGTTVLVSINKCINTLEINYVFNFIFFSFLYFMHYNQSSV